MGVLKWLIRAVVALVVLIGLMLGGLLLLPQDKLARIASDQLSAQLGRRVDMGRVGLSFFPVAGFKVSDLRVANAEWAGDAPMVAAQSAALGVDTRALLQGRIAIESITADAPKLNLIRQADGRANWEFTQPSQDAAAPSKPSSTSSDAKAHSALALEGIGKLVITNGTVSFSDAGQVTQVRDLDLTLRWPNASGPMTVSGKARPLSGLIGYDVTLDSPNALIAGGASGGAVALRTAGGDISYTGQIGADLAGRLRLNITSTAALAADFGQAGLALPRGLGASVQGQAAITFQGNRFGLRDADLTLEQNRLSARADVTLGAKPQINAVISAPNLDLSAISDSGAPAPNSPKGSGSGASGGGSKNASAAGWSTDPIDLSFLNAFDGKVDFTTGGLQAAGFSFGKTDASVSVERARAVFDLRQLQGYGGQMSGQFVANNRNGLSTRIAMSLDQVNLRPLLKDAMDVDRFEGPASGQVNLLASGNSVAALMRSLSGEGNLRAGPGVLHGIDLASAAQGKADGGTTVFDTATLSFTAKDGVLRNKDLAMTLPGLQAKGDGRVDLGKRSIDYLATVIAPKARGGRGLAIPVRLKGPWENTTIRVDAGEVLDQNFADEKKKVEKQVRKKVEKEVGKALGVKVEEGQSLEDAAKGALKKEVEKQLGKDFLNLLGGN